VVAVNFEGLRGYSALDYEGQTLRKAIGCRYGRDFQASVCIANMCVSVPSLHTESTDSVIHMYFPIWALNR
jgi:hypothetical protein